VPRGTSDQLGTISGRPAPKNVQWQKSHTFSGDYISALRGCCPLKFLHVVQIDQGLLWHTPRGRDTPQNYFNRENLKFGLKFSVLQSITTGLVGVSSLNFSVDVPCCEKNFDNLHWLSTRTCCAGRPHVGLCPALVVGSCVSTLVKWDTVQTWEFVSKILTVFIKQWQWIYVHKVAVKCKWSPALCTFLPPILHSILHSRLSYTYRAMKHTVYCGKSTISFMFMRAGHDSLRVNCTFLYFFVR